MKKDLERKILVIDEAWSLLSRTEDASYIFEIVKTCRKFNLGLFLINQEVEGMLESEAGRSVLANTSYTLLLRQKPAVIEDIQKTFHLSNTEKVNLLTANVGEGLLLMEDEHSEIKIVASELEHKQITTNADEILANNHNNSNKKQEQTKPTQPTAKKVSQKPAVKVVISVDKDKRFYRHRDLNLNDIKYLIAEGYKQYKFKSIFGNKKEFYLLKPNYNESPQHFFLIKDIEKYIRKFTDKVQIFNTGKPDIVFEVDNKKYAVEIETGKVLLTTKKKFIEKVRTLKKNYGKNWFFVVTNKNLQPKYSKFGETHTKSTIANKLFRLSKND